MRQGNCEHECHSRGGRMEQDKRLVRAQEPAGGMAERKGEVKQKLRVVTEL